MKITVNQLRKIIKEEVSRVMSESLNMTSVKELKVGSQIRLNQDADLTIRDLTGKVRSRIVPAGTVMQVTKPYDENQYNISESVLEVAVVDPEADPKATRTKAATGGGALTKQYYWIYKENLDKGIFDVL